MRRRFSGHVVVITGASSGIGRATALAFARAGAKVVVTARNEVALSEVCEQGHALGGQVVCVEADVTDPSGLEAVAGRAIEEFGRIDVWVNCAAVTLVAPFEEAPLEAFRRVVETNLFGYVHGARAALPSMRERGSGVLVNVSSQLGPADAPHESAYLAAQAAIRALSESLRQELRGSGIEVVTVLTASIDTPFSQHAANFSRHSVKPAGPVLPPERVARAILRAARSPKREVAVGHPGRLSRAVARRQISRGSLEHPAPESMGNLFAPSPPFGVNGGWQRPRRAGRKLALIGLAAAPLALAATLRQIRARVR